MKKNRRLITALITVMMMGCASTHYSKEDIKKEVQKTGIAESHFIKIESRSIHYLEAGRGEPMILIHGWLCWGAYWKKMIPHLKDSYHLYAPDLLGHGLSDKPLDEKISYNTEAQAKRILAMMDALSIKSAYIVGHSMGGEIAAKMAILAPERVRGLVLICAAGMKETPKRLPWYIRTGRFLHIESPAGSMLNETMIRWFVPGLMFYKENPMPEEFVEDIKMTNLSGKKDRKAMVRVTKEGLFQDFLDKRTAAITMPTLIISAKYDRVVVPEMGERYHKLIPQSQYLLIDRAAHMAPWEEAEQISTEITRFLAAP
ncbi:MAG: hypothetical protein CVV44_14160 [Spirochaetae bacterium HGW-Spirochaetae-1]|jgi:pimeloyl-ACP methyl ester carboxylesterase|nr:MAG: hypothetical protein CVV44_14160 [Spirochaetae bacterium HGW-Spirochaetae-1]